MDKKIIRILISAMTLVVAIAFMACNAYDKPLYKLNPTEPAVSETTMTTEATDPAETYETEETTTPTETSVEETTFETSVTSETTKPTATAAPAKKPAETTKKTNKTTTKSTTKKKSTKKRVRKTNKKSSEEDWDGYDDDDAQPAKKPTKAPTATPTPKPYTYCTCDAVVDCGSKAYGNWHEFTLKGLTARKTKAGNWVLTEHSLDKVEDYIDENYPHTGGYGVKKLANRRDYRYKA